MSGATAFARRFQGGFRTFGSLVIRTAPSLAGIVFGRRIGRGWDSVGTAVSNPSIHTLPAFLAPALLSFVAQIYSSW
jgi:hypothetical protein